MLIPDVIEPAIKIDTTTFSFLFPPTWSVWLTTSLLLYWREMFCDFLVYVFVIAFVLDLSSVAFLSDNAIILPLNFRNSSSLCSFGFCLLN